MNVALATSQVTRSSAVMTARNGRSVEEGADAQSVSGSDKDASVSNRFPIIAFSYDREASRLVLLYRDPKTGSTVSQIPTEVALKQYEEALQKEKKETARQLHIVVGGAGETGNSGTSSKQNSGTSAVSVGAGTATAAVSSDSGPAASTSTASAGTVTSATTTTSVNMLV